MGFSWEIGIILIATSCSFSNGYLRCKQSCSMKEDLDCQVKYIGPSCYSTAVESSSVWPGKPQSLSVDQFNPTLNSSHQGEVGLNVSWRMPNDASALAMTGFEINLYLSGDQVVGVRNCYVMSLNTSQIRLKKLVSMIFTMECYVTKLAEGVTTMLYGLPRPESGPTSNQVKIYTEIIVPTTKSTSPCVDDPGISTILSQDGLTPQLVVTLLNYRPNSRYKISLMQGAYEMASQKIQPDKRTGPDKAVFENATLLRPGQCFSIWALLSVCDIRDGVWTHRLKFCVPITTSTTTTTTMSPVLTKDVKPVQAEEEPGQEEALSPSSIIIVSVFSALGVILVGAIAVFFMTRNRRCPDPEFPKTKGYKKVPANPLIEDGPPKEPEEVKRLVVLYDIDIVNCKTVQMLMEYLKKICPDVHIYDFVDVDGVEQDFGGWFQKVAGKAVSCGGRLLIVYSEGLMKLMEASRNQMHYRLYAENVLNGEHIPSFLSLMKNSVFYKRNPCFTEWVISLGEDIHEDFHKGLVHFNGVQLNLFQWCNDQLSIHDGNSEYFLNRLGVKDVKSALADPLMADVLKTSEDVQKSQTNPDWFTLKFGNPEPTHVDHEKEPATDSSSLCSSSSDSNSDERSNSFAMEGQPNGVDMSSEQCPDYVEIDPPDYSYEDDSGV